MLTAFFLYGYDFYGGCLVMCLVESLAALAGVSRASLTRRFNATLGVSPMTYVTQWRLALAADLLDRSDATLSAIAHQVGYASPFSFSSAFKSRYGLSPRDFRTAAATSCTHQPPSADVSECIETYSPRDECF